MILTATVKVEIEIPDSTETVTDSNGDCFAFKLADGRIVEPSFCVRVESADGLSEQFAANDDDMQAVGVVLVNYHEIMLEVR
jgi:hypothetical protein